MSQDRPQQVTKPQRTLHKRLLVVGLLVLTTLVSQMIYRSWGSPPPKSLGIHEGRLSPCPSSPNCVCSQDADAGHSIAAIPLADDPARQWEALKQVVTQQPRTTLVTVEDTYLHAEFRSFLFRFVDDVEFFVDTDAQVIQVRSASRVGHSDLGVNRARLEQLRSALQQALAEPTH